MMQRRRLAAFVCKEDQPKARFKSFLRRFSLRGLGLDVCVGRKEARDAVYSLTYSIIMLNTDLANPVIWPKMTDLEYVASCHRCTPLAPVPAEALLQIHERIRTAPLQITPHSSHVDTTVHSTSEGEVATPATYSIYSGA